MGATAPAERIESLDILRGLALFGVLVVNLVVSFRGPFLQYVLLPDPSRPLHDRAAEMAIRVALEGKALTLFAFLFGAGLAMQHERLSRWHAAPGRLLRRRLAVLFAFGLAHLLLLWNGDILTEYALVGLAALACLQLPAERLERWLPRLLLLSIVLSFFTLPFTFPEGPALEREIARATVVHQQGTWLQVRTYALEEFLRLAPMYAGLLPQTLAIFIAGMLAWRRGYLGEPAAHAPALRRLAAWGLGAGGALTLANQVEPEGLLYFARLATVPVAALLLAAGYAAALLLLLRREEVREAMRPFADLGRMAFTHYIVQSLVFGFVFYGYGLGLFGRLGTLQALAIGVTLYALQVAASRWWLARYRYGPLEWAWRSLTYGERQPMRR